MFKSPGELQKASENGPAIKTPAAHGARGCVHPALLQMIMKRKPKSSLSL